jgi:hypothetical protein
VGSSVVHPEVAVLDLESLHRQGEARHVEVGLTSRRRRLAGKFDPHCIGPAGDRRGFG